MPTERPASTVLRIALVCVLMVPAIAIASDKGESITGRVSTLERHLEGVTIALRVAGSATVVATAVTGQDGKYRLRGVADGAYIVTPEKAGYVFTPRTRSVTIEDDAVKTQDFVAFTAHAISGRVTTNHGGASTPLTVAGITLSLRGADSATAITDSDGTYSFTGLIAGNYTITPSGGVPVPSSVILPLGADTSASFSPASRSVVVNQVDIVGQDFNAFNACAAVSVCVDADGDGLCDAWEIAGGIDVNGDGVVDAVNDVLLPGADPHRKDIYLELDYMVAADHNHAPHPDAIQTVVDAFARKGIALHVDAVHDAIPETPVVTFNPLDAVCSGLPPSASNFFDLKARYSDPKRKSAYHYGIFAHYNTCESPMACSLCPPEGGIPIAFGTAGKGELPGNDLIVSTGTIFDAGVAVAIEHEAGILMHELGHNLGLQHGGDGALPDFKPNYLSVINDNFVFTGIPVAATPGSVTPLTCVESTECPSGAICAEASGTCTRIDYSTTALPALDESGLDETLGIAAGTNDITTYNCPDFTPVPGAATGPIDWNCNGDSTERNVVANINADGGLPTGPLTGHADWPNLLLKFQCFPAGSANAPRPRRFVAERGLSVEEARKRGRLFAPRAVQIEILPDDASGSHAVSLSRSGVVSVVLFGSARLDVSEVDARTLKLAGASPLKVEVTDVNGDGHADLVLVFDIASLNFRVGTTKAALSGQLHSSQLFAGEAAVTVLP